MKAIETLYKGYRFRSRLEARWAVFFDGIGAEWDYELEGFILEGFAYLPDFFLRIRPEWEDAQKFAGAGYWFEVKPRGQPDYEAITKARLLCRATKNNVVILCGDPKDFNYLKFHRIRKEPIRSTADMEYPDLMLECLFHVFTDHPGEISTSANLSRSARFDGNAQFFDHGVG